MELFVLSSHPCFEKKNAAMHCHNFEKIWADIATNIFKKLDCMGECH